MKNCYKKMEERCTFPGVYMVKGLKLPEMKN